ncbi:MAG: hypothetical protein HZB23_09230 [Deltaproteobacteria bacterium]|nr:hypothetical protein [Deltaproteobacteria bacterium]
MDRNGLKRFFEGLGPEDGPSLSLAIADKPQVAFKGEGLSLFESRVTLYDFGLVSARGVVSREIEVENLGDGPVALGISFSHACFGLSFAGKESGGVVIGPEDSARIALVFRADGTEGKNTAQAMFKAKNSKGALAAFPVLLAADARRDYASARFGYNGSEAPHVHEFRIRPAMLHFPEALAFRLDMESNGPRPFQASFSSSSALLRMGLDGARNEGGDLFVELPPGASGSVFIEPALPTALAGGGVTELRVLCSTNHVLEIFRSFYLDFKIIRESDEAFVTFDVNGLGPSAEREMELPLADALMGSVLAVKTTLVNWGAKDAPVSCESGSGCAELEGSVTVPGFSGDRPGRARVEIKLDTVSLDEGVHRIPVFFKIPGKIPGQAENGLTLFVNLRVFSIRLNPEMLDFGVVNAGESSTLRLSIRASEPGIDITGLAALPVQGLAGQIEAKIGPDGLLTATLGEPENFRERKPFLDGPGITLDQPEWSFQKDVRVRFSRTAPRLYLKKSHIDLGSLLEGEEAFFDLVLENRGDGDLHAVMEPAGPGIAVVPARLSIRPGERMGATLTVKAPKGGGKDGEVRRSAVLISTNEPGAAAQTLSFSYTSAALAGRLCPNPSCPSKKWREVIPASFSRCPKCGAAAPDGKPVPLSETRTCQDQGDCENRKCGGMYFNCDDTFRFCPYYGKPLVTPQLDK